MPLVKRLYQFIGIEFSSRFVFQRPPSHTEVAKAFLWRYRARCKRYVALVLQALFPIPQS